MTVLYTQYGETIDLSEKVNIPFTDSVNDIRNIDKASGSFIKRFTAPGTANNNKILGYHYEVGIDSSFNVNKLLFVSLIDNSIPVQYGNMQLVQINKDGNNISYELVVYGSLSVFAKELGNKKLSDIDLSGLNHVLSWSAVSNSWSANTNYVYPLTDSVNYTLASIDGSTPNSNIKLKDLIPCIKVSYLWNQIFKDINWSYNKDWFNNNPYFNSLTITADGLFYADETLKRLIFKAQTDSTITISGWSDITNPGIVQQIAFYDSSIGGYNPNSAFQSGTTYIAPITMNASFEANIHTQPGAGSFCFLIKVNGNYVFQSPPYNVSSGNYPFDQWFNIVTPVLNLQAGDNVTFYIFAYAGAVPAFFETIIYAGSNLTIIPSNTVDEGGAVLFSDIINKNITQVQFVNAIINIFRLMAEEDKVNRYKNHIIFKPRNEYYKQGNIKDWSNKLDYSQPVTIELCSEVQSSEINFSWQQDSDLYNKIYSTKYGETFGSNTVEIDNAFLDPNSKTDIKPVFAATIVKNIVGSNSLVAPVFYDQDSNGAFKKIAPKTRLLFYGGLYDCEPIAFSSGATIVKTTKFPYAGTINSLYNPTFDLNWDVPQEIFMTVSGASAYSGFTYPETNIYTTYWESYIDEINDPNSKLITAYFKLSPFDINQLAFSDSIFIDNIYYKLNKIIDYQVGQNSLCKVELLKSKNQIPKVKGSKYIKRAPVNTDVAARVIGNNNTVINPMNSVIGNNNYVDARSVFNTIIGDDHKLSVQGSMIMGVGHSANSRNITIIGGSRNTIENSVNSSIINSYKSGIYENSSSSIMSSRNSVIHSGATGSTILNSDNVIIHNSAKDNYVTGSKNIIVCASTENALAFGVRNLTISSSNTAYFQSLVIQDVASISERVLVHESDGRVTARAMSGLTSVAGIGAGTPGYYGFIVSSATHYIKAFSGGSNVWLTSTDGKNIIINSSASTSTVNYWTGDTLGNLIQNNNTGNLATGYSSIVAGTYNRIGFLGVQSSIIGGYNNYVNAAYSNIFGSRQSINNQAYSSIFGGLINKNYALKTAIFGGQYNTIQSYGNYSNILGGNSNFINSLTSIIGTGNNNKITGDSSYSLITNGKNNIIAGLWYSSIINGFGNKIKSVYNHNTILGGSSNYIKDSNYGIIGQGISNYVAGTKSVILNGGNNSINGNWSTIINGEYNTITNSSYSSILAGAYHTIDSCDNSAIIGGSGLMLSAVSNIVLVSKLKINDIPTGSTGSVLFADNDGNVIKDAALILNSISANTITSQSYNGGYRYVSGNTSFTALTSDHVIEIYNPSSAITLYLPDVSSYVKGQHLYIVGNFNSGAFPITVNAQGGKIRGSSTFVMNSDDSVLHLFNTGAQWIILNNYLP